MARVYLRPVNISFGDFAKNLIETNKALSLCGRDNAAFTHVEIIRKNETGEISKKLVFYKAVSEESDHAICLPILHRITSKRNLNLKNINLNKPIIVGVLNLTPDSFSDGGKYNNKVKALDHVEDMVTYGATMIDVGGESTRPGSTSVTELDEIKRVSEIIKLIKKKYSEIPISLDTRKSEVMKHGNDIGVDLFNDVSALDFDNKSSDVVLASKKPIILNHSQGTPDTMQLNPTYGNAVLDIYDYFETKIKTLKSLGINDDQIIIDPGIGFGKTVEHNLEILSSIAIYHGLGYPIMVGPSRKSFIGKLMKELDSNDRIGGTIASVLFSLSQGVQMFRVHDVKIVNESFALQTEFLNRSR